MDVTEQIYRLRNEYIDSHFISPTEVYITKEAENMLFREEIERETYFPITRFDLRAYTHFLNMKIFWDSDKLRVV